MPTTNTKIRDCGAALPCRLHWFETEVLTQAANLRGLALMNRELIAKAERQEWKEIPASNDKPKARQILLGLF